MAQLLAEGQPVDLVYNRLVDFALDRPEHAALRAAYLDDAVVVTPNPRVHALYADKRNLILLSDQAALQSWGLAPEMIADLAGVPHTVLVTSQNAEQLWERRKTLFFKPAGGHGGKAVYRGDKVTKGVWADIIRGGYVAQEFAAPSERMIKLDGSPQARKTDVRLYVYDGQILLTAARCQQRARSSLPAGRDCSPAKLDSTNHPRGIRMTEVAALNRDIAKRHPENVFESPLEIVDEILLTRGEKLATLKRWQFSILGDLATSKMGWERPATSPDNSVGSSQCWKRSRKRRYASGKVRFRTE